MSRLSCLGLGLLVMWGCTKPFEGPPAHADERTDERVPALPDLERVEQAAQAHPTFERYWYRGKAELNRYALSQSRYGKQHAGEAVLIFVTEDFLRTKQVKLEGLGDRADAVSVLKLNAYRRFYTGIYPYTLMTSVFVPARTKDSPLLKLTFTATEWCGQSFMQLNRRTDYMDVQVRSYFEAEGDSDRRLAHALTEDELLVRVRRDPKSLPTGKISLLPAAQHARLRHVPFSTQDAVATLSAPDQGKRRYRIVYADGHSMELSFEEAFPHRIVAFEEQPGPGQPTTRATLTRSILLPYWEKHFPEDARYRTALGLEW